VAVSIAAAKGVDDERDHIKGKTKPIAGRVQQKAGATTGSSEQQVKGMRR